MNLIQEMKMGHAHLEDDGDGDDARCVVALRHD